MKKIEVSGPKTVAFFTLGCKVNQYESASFLSSFENRGLTVVPFTESADIYIINTCAVTAKAGAQSRQYIRRAIRQNPKARIVVTGCYAQVASLDVLDLSEDSICIVGNGFKDKLVDIATSGSRCDLEMHMGDITRKKEICELPVHRFEGRTRAYLKIQDGCNRFCTYCIVPYARGRSRSLAPEKVLEQARVFANEGYKELVVTGIHAGAYGHDLEPATELLPLLKMLVGEQLPLRYRLSSLEPTEITKELLEFMRNSPAIMPHLHIPLQSGDDTVLRKMNRKYDRDFFAGVIAACKQYLPGAAVGVDVLVGFPGEDESAFRQTANLLFELPISYFHVFPYSKRAGTLAAAMPDQIPGPVKDQRVRELRSLDSRKRQQFYADQVGTIRKVLVESRKTKPYRLKGFTDNYIPVYFKGQDSLINTVVDVVIERIEGDKVHGALVK